MDEIQRNIDRLAQIIANYVGVNDIGYDALDALQPAFDWIKAGESSRAFWNERFGRAKKQTKKFV